MSRNLKLESFAVIIALLALAAFTPQAQAGSMNLSPRGVNPYGLTLSEAYGTLTPMASMTMASYGVCGYLNPNPSKIFGASCFNGSNNATMIFNVTSWENRQGSYKFLLYSFGNGTLGLRFIGAPPGQIAASSSRLVQSSAYVSGIETILSSGQNAEGVLCIAYTGGCGGLVPVPGCGLFPGGVCNPYPPPFQFNTTTVCPAAAIPFLSTLIGCYNLPVQLLNPNLPLIAAGFTGLIFLSTVSRPERETRTRWEFKTLKPAKHRMPRLRRRKTDRRKSLV